MSNLKTTEIQDRLTIYKTKLSLEEEQLKLLRDKYQLTPKKDTQLTDAEFIQFMAFCVTYGLDPLTNEATAIKFGGRMTPVTTIGGLRSKAEETGCYVPSDKAPAFETDKNGKLISATVWIKKFVKDSWHEIAGVAYWRDYGSDNSSPMWKKMPYVMLAKCAEANAIRKAFPKFAALYDRDEINEGNYEEVNLLMDVTPVKAVDGAPFVVNGKSYTADQLQMFLEKQLNDIHSRAELLAYDRLISNHSLDLLRFSKAFPEKAKSLSHIKSNVIKAIELMEAGSNLNEKEQ